MSGNANCEIKGRELIEQGLRLWFMVCRVENGFRIRTPSYAMLLPPHGHATRYLAYYSVVSANVGANAFYEGRAVTAHGSLDKD